MEFSKRLDLFGDEIFAALNERKVALEAQGRTIYNLSVGTPDFAPAEHIRKAMMDAAADPQNWKYSLRDLPELLDAVCGYYKRRFGVEITPDQVASCAGSQEGVGHIGMVLCDAMLGEVTANMALAVGRSRAHKILLPVSKCQATVVGTAKMSMAEAVAKAIEETVARVSAASI